MFCLRMTFGKIGTSLICQFSFLFRDKASINEDDVYGYMMKIPGSPTKNNTAFHEMKFYNYIFNFDSLYVCFARLKVVILMCNLNYSCSAF